MAEIGIEGKPVEVGVDTFSDHLYLVYCPTLPDL